jgi:hypothetical protein
MSFKLAVFTILVHTKKVIGNGTGYRYLKVSFET